MNPDILKDLKYKLRLNLKEIIKRYSSYVDCVRSTIISKGVSARELCAYLLTLSAFSHLEKEDVLLSSSKLQLEKASDVNDIFIILITDYASFLNYGIFQTLLEKYAIDEGQEELRYPEHLKAYVEKHKISEFIEIKPILGKLTATMQKITLVFNINQTCKLAKLFELENDIAEILGITPLGLRLLDVERGSVVVTFLIPGYVARMIFTGNRLAEIFSQRQMERFRALHIQCLKYNNNEWHFDEAHIDTPILGEDRGNVPDSTPHSATGSGDTDEVSTLGSTITPLHNASPSRKDNVSTLATPDSTMAIASPSNLNKVSTLVTQEDSDTSSSPEENSEDSSTGHAFNSAHEKDVAQNTPITSAYSGNPSELGSPVTLQATPRSCFESETAADCPTPAAIATGSPTQRAAPQPTLQLSYESEMATHCPTPPVTAAIARPTITPSSVYTGSPSQRAAPQPTLQLSYESEMATRCPTPPVTAARPTITSSSTDTPMSASQQGSTLQSSYDSKTATGTPSVPLPVVTITPSPVYTGSLTASSKQGSNSSPISRPRSGYESGAEDNPTPPIGLHRVHKNSPTIISSCGRSRSKDFYMDNRLGGKLGKVKGVTHKEGTLTDSDSGGSSPSQSVSPMPAPKSSKTTSNIPTPTSSPLATANTLSPPTKPGSSRVKLIPKSRQPVYV